MNSKPTEYVYVPTINSDRTLNVARSDLAYIDYSDEIYRLNNLLATQKAHLLQYEADLNTSKQTIDALKAEVERLKNRETELMMRLTYALNPGP